jgi:hypothetical protein
MSIFESGNRIDDELAVIHRLGLRYEFTHWCEIDELWVQQEMH